MRSVAVIAMTVAALGGLLYSVQPAQASFPGLNGLIAFINAGNIFTIDPANPIPQQITAGGGFNNVAFNATGTRLVAEDASGVVFLDPTPGAAVTQLPNGNNNDDDPSFDPTGTRVTFENGNDIFVQDVTGANRTNITNTGGVAEVNPEWSADGTYIAYENATNFQIQRISPTGGGLITLTPAAAGCVAAAPCQAPSTSPNNLNVAYDQDGAPQGIFTVLASGASANSTRLSTGNDDNPSYAPDGTRVAFERGANVTTVPTDGSQVATNVTPGTRANWGVRAGGVVTPTPTGGVTPTPVANVAPTFSGTSGCGSTVAAPLIGGPGTQTVSASDANAGQNVTLALNSAPAGVTLNPNTPGNPATGQLNASTDLITLITSLLGGGTQQATITATDNGNPPLSTTCTITIRRTLGFFGF